MGTIDVTVQAIVFRIATLLIASGVHGGIIAGAAVLLGDKGPRYDGRLTLSPFGQVDFVGAVSMVLFGWGWSKPVEVDARDLRFGSIGVAIVILAGFVGLLITAALLDAMIRRALTALPYSAGLTAAAFLQGASDLTIAFALLSLVPIPPLAGGSLLYALGLRIPQKARWVVVLVLLVAAATGTVRELLGPAQAVLTSLILVE